MSNTIPQLCFFTGYDIRQARPTRLAELDTAFQVFHEANPGAWRLFVRFTFDVIRRGFKHYSAKSVFERIRWHTDIETGAADGFKLNNNWTASYARLFHKAYPEHDGFFRLRARTTSKASPARVNHERRSERRLSMSLMRSSARLGMVAPCVDRREGEK